MQYLFFLLYAGIDQQSQACIFGCNGGLVPTIMNISLRTDFHNEPLSGQAMIAIHMYGAQWVDVRWHTTQVTRKSNSTEMPNARYSKEPCRSIQSHT